MRGKAVKAVRTHRRDALTLQMPCFHATLWALEIFVLVRSNRLPLTLLVSAQFSRTFIKNFLVQNSRNLRVLTLRSFHAFFFAIFLLIPLIEVGLFIVVGQHIGVLDTLLLCVLSAVVGSFLLRQQGMQTLLSVTKSLDRGQLPMNELFDGVCLAIAGALMVTPGFFTDAIGFSLLIPPVRHALRKVLVKHYGFSDMPPPDIVEAEFVRIEEESSSL
jgi:UPF0716 protein FxsA